MTPQLSFEVIYRDVHLIEVLINASNGRYSGTTTIYLSGDGKELIEFGHKLQGFPKSNNHIEKQEFGFTRKYQEDFLKLKKAHSEVKPASAYIGLEFHCIDDLGHAAVDITVQEDFWSERPEAIGKVYFEMRFEPAQIDNFVQGLLSIGEKKEGEAILEGIIDEKDSLI